MDFGTSSRYHAKRNSNFLLIYDIEAPGSDKFTTTVEVQYRTEKLPHQTQTSQLEKAADSLKARTGNKGGSGIVPKLGPRSHPS